METQKIQIAKTVLRKKNGAGGINLPDSDYTTKLQSSREYFAGKKEHTHTHTHTHTHKYRPMGKDRKQPMGCSFLQMRQEYTMRQRQPLQFIVLGKLDSWV